MRVFSGVLVDDRTGFSAIVRTTNGGRRWTQQTSGTTATLFGVSFVDEDTGTAVGTGGTILRTTTGGGKSEED